MNADEIAKMIKSLAPVCREAGIKRLCVEGIEMELEDPNKRPSPQDLEALAKAMGSGLPSEDEVLNWSSPGYVPPTNREN